MCCLFPAFPPALQLTINCFSSSSSSFDTVCPLWCPLSLSLSHSSIGRLPSSPPPPTLHTESDLSCELQTSSSSSSSADFCSKCRPFSFTFTHSFHYYTPCYTCTNTCPFLSLSGSISGRHGVRHFSLVSLHHVCVRTVVVVGGGGGGNAETIEES